uniref:Centromere protein N n=1 Tax=Equus caballus TaxID=9796 RepID=A0A9L0RNL3_HORSE
MDETVAEFFKRTILKIPMAEMMTILKAWDFLSENQLQTVNFRQRKESLVQDLVLLCEKKRASLNDAAILDIVLQPVRNVRIKTDWTYIWCDQEGTRWEGHALLRGLHVQLEGK